jgi:hypothetical protein
MSDMDVSKISQLSKGERNAMIIGTIYGRVRAIEESGEEITLNALFGSLCDAGILYSEMLACIAELDVLNSTLKKVIIGEDNKAYI